MYSALWKKNGEQIRPSFISVNAHVVDLAAQIVFTKTYSNVGNNFKDNLQQEATFKAHLNTSIGVLTGFEIKLDGKITSAEVVNQAEAMKQFESNQSNTNIVKEADFNDPFIQEDFFLCKLNNLAQYNELEIIITYVTEMTMQGDYLYLVFPTSLSTVRSTQQQQQLETPPSLPNSHNNSNGTSSTGESQRQGLLIKLDLEMPSSIQEVKSPSHPEGIEAQWNESTGTVIYKDTRPVDVVNQSDLVVLVKLENPHEPTGFAERNKDGSRAVMVVFYPKLEPVKKQQEMELIFLVDCSESMEGYNITHAKKGLLLFSHSLPKGTYFNIISFGSTHQKLFPQSLPYCEENLAQANTFIKGLKADSGNDTNLLAPLKDIYATSATRPRKIFLLTDGGVNNTGQIAELVRQNADNTSVFPIGMGEFVSKQLVDAIASAGCGVAELAIENETIENKVMRQLKRALQPAYTNIRMDWGSISSNKQSPRDLRTLFDGDRLTVFSILEPNERVPDNGTVKLNANGPNGPVSFQVNIKGNEIKRGNLVHCLAAYTLILDLEQQAQECNDVDEAERLKKRIIDLGVKYSLGTNYTSFISLEDPTMPPSPRVIQPNNNKPTVTPTPVSSNNSFVQNNPAFSGLLNALNSSSGSIHHYPEHSSAMISLRGSASGIPTNLNSSSSSLKTNVSPSRPTTTTTNTTAPAVSTPLKSLSPASPPFTPTQSTMSSAAAPFTPGAFAKSQLKFSAPEFVPKGIAPSTPSALKPSALVFTPTKTSTTPAVVTPTKAEEPKKVEDPVKVEVVTPTKAVEEPKKEESPKKVEEPKVEVAAATATPVKVEESPKKVEEPVAKVEVAAPVKVEVTAPVAAAVPAKVEVAAPVKVEVTAPVAKPAPVVVAAAAAAPVVAAAAANSTSPPAKRQYSHDYLMSLKDLPSNTVIPEKLKQHANILMRAGSSGIFNKEKDRRGNRHHDKKNSEPLPPPKKIITKDTQGEFGETYKKFKFNLNLITMDTYATIIKNFEGIVIPNEEVLGNIAKILFEKAIIDQKYSAVFAILTHYLDSKYPKFENNKTLKRDIITNCQKEFELHLTDTYDRSKFDTLSKEDRDEEEFIIKRRFLGNIKFIGELYKHSVLAESIVLNYCVAKLLEKANTHVEDTIEGMAKLISNIGKKLDADPSKPGLAGVFSQVRQLSENEKLTSRARYLLLDLLDLRAGRWEPKNNTISKVNKEENDKEERFVSKHGSGRRDDRDKGDRRDRNDRNDRGDRRDRDRHDRNDRNDRNNRDDRNDRNDRGIFGKSKDGWETVGKSSPKGKQTPKKGDLSNSRDNISNSKTPPRPAAPATLKKSGDERRNVFAALDDDDYDMPSSPKKPTPKDTGKQQESKDTKGKPADASAAAQPVSATKLEADVSMTLDEFLELGDPEEALECIKELNYPTLYSKIICIIVNKSFEKNNTEKQSIVELFNQIITSQIYPAEAFKEGFKEVLATIEDTEIDLPFASKFLAELIGFCIEADILTLNYVEENYLHLVDSGKAEEMLKDTLISIVKHSDSDRLVDIYEKTADLDILKLFRPKNRTTQYLQEFFQEHFPYLSSDRVAVSQSEPSLIEHLLVLQKAEGNFELTNKLAGVLNIPLSDIEKAENSDSLARTHPNIWATVLAYSFMSTNFTEEQDDLELINQKIQSWLNAELELPDAPKLSLDDLVKKAKRFISEY
ncbi:type A von Willebrand factor domain-containing protein [Cavenderia fasciculata]|uniref:Type A von Willebrand factor domain-containing protein n=1 Tax=Cavenderia fasciculata TaxID=261658 RepID=F4PLC0_CACFS|nr:type A von Willebrand factor domain-containing protein [Cavenderia fasciculata]EGG23342.1 type A von Willebrand factor domain-containing protein [Cavenderia fasciculata]|eukprot:XP_004361193.1 type A von Willebrand factor domain-containing protein [Cavenderia fasciculata]